MHNKTPASHTSNRYAISILNNKQRCFTTRLSKIVKCIRTLEKCTTNRKCNNAQLTYHTTNIFVSQYVYKFHRTMQHLHQHQKIEFTRFMQQLHHQHKTKHIPFKFCKHDPDNQENNFLHLHHSSFQQFPH